MGQDLMALFRDQNYISTENSLRKRRRHFFMKEYLDDSWCILLINYPPRFLEAFKPQSLQGMIFTATTKPYPWPNVSDTGFNRIQHASLIFRLFEVKLQTSPPTGAWKVTDTRTEPTEFDITVFLSTIRLRTWQTLDEENRRSNRVPIFFFERNKTEPFFFRGFLHSRLRHLPLDRSLKTSNLHRVFASFLLLTQLTPSFTSVSQGTP